ncbi:MAG TPA: adenylate/guanylate cyclase domain-containing protein, partial [Roseiflexaceae bacterium]|nr:adenylate/guanylate cyclase domain-containing protein [Roseiflexaceae bacterium]
MSELISSYSPLLEGWLPGPLLRALRQPEPAPDALAEACARLEAACARVEPFAPAPVVSRLAAAPLPYERIAGAYLSGTVLVAEIAGLVALSTRLAAGGRQGDEAASAVVSRLLATLIAAVHAHGGGVVKAGGDSLMAFFDERTLGEAHAAQACAAGLAMQAHMAALELPREAEAAPLRLRVAAHSGRVLAVEVGDQTHTELLVTGHTISRVARALLGAAPGEVIVTDKLLQHVEGADAPLKLAGQHLLRALAAPPPPPPP